MKYLSQKEKDSADQSEASIKKFCHACKTTKTPMWRVGPSGPNSLCNACGIKFGKKSRKESSNKGKRRSTKKSQNRSKNGCVQVGLRGLGQEVVLLKKQRSSSSKQRKQRKMGEVEQAALVLMSLSSVSEHVPKKHYKESTNKNLKHQTRV